MPVTQEMHDRAEKFTYRYHKETREEANAQLFMVEFFAIFGLDLKSLASFEYPIRRPAQTKRYADLFWPSKLLVEAKSANKDSDADWENTLKQALTYIDALKTDDTRPKHLLLFNFKRIKLYQLHYSPIKKKATEALLCEFELLELPKYLHFFNFFLTIPEELRERQIRVNQKAANYIATIHDKLELEHYGTKDAAVLLSQILFCLFAEDTGIFEPLQFTNYVKQFEKQPEKLGTALLDLFQYLNTDPKKQKKTPAAVLTKFPFVNGRLFNTQPTQTPPTSAGAYQALYEACLYDWSEISPEIFGSLFQAVMNPEERRNLGAHYTSETNILRLLNPLLLNELRTEFANSKGNKRKIIAFRKKINQLKFLDPACGCGNFLVVTYRELRLLDIQVVAELQGTQMVTDTALLSNIPLQNFYGYEIDPTAAHIATLAMWLTEHQMNLRFLAHFGTAQPTIPLNDAANVTNTNALQTAWHEGMDFIVGNPPFVGKHLQNEQQKQDVERIFQGVNAAGVMDYVACWHLTAAKYIVKHPQTRIAFVSTNSIAQGEQTGILWGELFGKYGIKIHFAHQTFRWSNEAKGIAAVHCVIIGFGKTDIAQKILFEYDDIKGEPKANPVKNINGYLVEGNDFVILKRTMPISAVSQISRGNMANDGGNFIFSTEEKDAFLKKEPNAEKFIRQYMGADDFINNKKRWCLWLLDASPREIKSLRIVSNIVEKVRRYRLQSSRPTTQKLADTPYLFAEIRQPHQDFLVIPSVSSERRQYIPIGYEKSDIIVNTDVSFIPDASLYLFGLLCSLMHMAWVKYTCGRLKSDYRYSNTIVYNNYPFPKEVSEKKRLAVEKAAQAVLDIRLAAQEKGNTLADLYDPNTMPADLRKAHKALDTAVDKCYRDAPFKKEADRISFLFNLYEQYTADLFAEKKGKKKTKK